MRMRADLHVDADEKVEFSIHSIHEGKPHGPDLYAIVRFGTYSDGGASIYGDSPECLRRIAKTFEEAASELERART